MKVTLKADWGEVKKGDVIDIKDKTVISALAASKMIDKPNGFKEDQEEYEEVEKTDNED